MKYKTLKALKAAYDSGKISEPMMIDNDNTSVWQEGNGQVFAGGSPEDLLREALDLLGIPNEGV